MQESLERPGPRIRRGRSWKKEKKTNARNAPGPEKDAAAVARSGRKDRRGEKNKDIYVYMSLSETQRAALGLPAESGNAKQSGGAARSPLVQ